MLLLPSRRRKSRSSRRKINNKTPRKIKSDFIKLGVFFDKKEQIIELKKCFYKEAFFVDYFAFFAILTKSSNAFGSLIASSANIFLLTLMFALLRPLMNLE